MIGDKLPRREQDVTFWGGWFYLWLFDPRSDRIECEALLWAVTPPHAQMNASNAMLAQRSRTKSGFKLFRLMQRKSLSFLDIEVSMCFLDFGCGAGYVAPPVAR